MLGRKGEVEGGKGFYHGDGVSVDSSHEETKNGADGEELGECGAVDGCDL